MNLAPLFYRDDSPEEGEDGTYTTEATFRPAVVKSAQLVGQSGEVLKTFPLDIALTKGCTFEITLKVEVSSA